MQSCDGWAAVAEVFAAVVSEPSELSVVAAVMRDLAALGDQAVAESGLAAAALALARELDEPANSATSKSMCARALAEVLGRLREQAPPAEDADRLDDLSARRAARRGVAR